MNDEQFTKEVMKVIAESTETEMQITAGTHLYNDMGLASVEVYILLCDLEEAFHIRIPAAAVRTVETVGDFCHLVREKLSPEK